MLKSPYPYFGGKAKIAPLVWQRFGDVENYVEPFFGSGAVLLARPHRPRIETINDKDCMVANFWRALQKDPQATALAADWPVNEADQHARHLWLVKQLHKSDFRERMTTDPEFYDPKIAGWWVWGMGMWIGSGWCQQNDVGDGCYRKRPDMGSKGVHRQRPHLGGAGAGVHRKRPHLGDAGKGVSECSAQGILHTSATDNLLAYFHDLAERMRRVRVCCGDWSRVCGSTPTVKQGLTGVFLDPPYAAEADREISLYSVEDLTISKAVREWAIEWGCDPRMRIALCGYDKEHVMPGDWECVNWKASGGYGSQGEIRGRDNANRERIWFSPHCRNRTLLGMVKGLK